MKNTFLKTNKKQGKTHRISFNKISMKMIIEIKL